MNSRPSLLQDAAADVPVSVDARTSASGRVRWKRWIAAAALFALFVTLANVGASLMLRPQHVRARLDARLAAGFGRPVQVNSYSFSFWGGPTLQAEGIRVGEDPRFGREYFLYADSLAVKLRWLSLLRGRFELASLSLTGPTLNVVTDSSGDWNLSEWLGHSSASSPTAVGPVRPGAVPRFREISVDGGRVNFKRGDEKLAFAFTNVAGTISSDDAQRWSLDLEATPWHAAELLQQAGMIHLSGNVGGTSSALRPGNLQLEWSDASVSDFMRLLTGDDSGLRGDAALAVNAQTVASGWAIEGHAQLGNLHRSDLTARPDVPSFSITAHSTLDLSSAKLSVSDFSVDGTHSNLRGSGTVMWSSGAVASPSTVTSSFVPKFSSISPKTTAPNPVDFNIQSASIDLNDALSWLRAFRSNVPDGVRISGLAKATGSVVGWPARIDSLSLQTAGVQMSGGNLTNSLALGPAQFVYANGAFSMPPATITLAGAKGATAGTFHLETVASAKPTATAKQSVTGAMSAAELRVSGSATDASDVIAAAAAFGWNPARGVQLMGPLHCDLLWPRMEWPWSEQPTGTISIGGTGSDAASLGASFLNLPVTGLQLRMDMKPGAQHATLAAAQAFGGHWTGTFDRTIQQDQWDFALNTDHLNTVDLDRWLNPTWRESFIDRMLPFLNSSAPSAVVPETLRGTGRLTIGEFSAASIVAQNLTGTLSINGRDVSLDDASGSIAKGRFSGAIDARFDISPNYDGHVNFSGIDLAALAGTSSSTNATFGGTAAGAVQFSMQGTSRGNLADSLECKGAMDIRNGVWRGVDLLPSLQAATLTPGSSAFSDATGQFQCANDALDLKNLVISSSRAEVDAEGTIDFSRRLDMQVRVVPAVENAPASASSAPPVRVTGDPAAPDFSRPNLSRRAR